MTKTNAVIDNSTRGRLSAKLTALLLLPILGLLAFGLIWPLTTMLSRSVFTPNFNLNQYVRLFSEPLYLRTFIATLQLAFTVTVLTLFLAYPYAYIMSRARSKIVSILLTGLIISLWTSALVRSYAWILLLQRSGIVNETLLSIGLVDKPLKLLYTNFSVTIAMTHILLPFMILPIHASLTAISPDFEKAARNLGAGSMRSFWHVTLPLSLPGVYAGVLMVFILAIGFYITPALVGGPRNLMISTLIAQNVTTTLDWPFAAALSGVLLAITITLISVFNRFLNLKGGK